MKRSCKTDASGGAHPPEYDECVAARDAGGMRRFQVGCLIVLVLGATRATAEDAPKSAPPPACPVLPLRLVVKGPDGGTSPVLTLDAQGNLTAPFVGEAKALARLDARGCLVAKDGVWVERLANGDLWTLRQIVHVEGDLLRQPPGPTLRFAPDGTVESLSPTGAVEPAVYGSLRVEGYGPDARCAAQILVTTFTGMMPSMAVVDGKPVSLPRPAGSVCGPP